MCLCAQSELSGAAGTESRDPGARDEKAPAIWRAKMNKATEEFRKVLCGKEDNLRWVQISLK